MKMNASQIGLLLIIVVFTVLSGFADAEGFVHASATWVNGQIIWKEVLLSLLGFAVGATCYILVANFLQRAGIVSAEIQTMIWFLVAILGVATISGKILHWHRLEQVVAIVAILCVGWLVIRTGG